MRDATLATNPHTERYLPHHPRRVSRAVLFTLLFFQTVGWKQFEIVDLVAVSSLVAIALHALTTPTTETARRALPAILSLLGLTCYSLIVTISHDGLDPQFALRSVRAALNLAGVAALIDLYVQSVSGKQNSAEVVAADGFSVLVVHGLVMLVMYVEPTIRELIYSITDAHSNVNLFFPFLTGLRITGLTYGLSLTSALQASALAIGLANIRYWYRNRHRATFFIVGCCVTLGSILISGRSGLVIAFIAVVFGVWSASKAELASPAEALPRREILASAGIGVVLAGIAVALAPPAFVGYTIETVRRTADLPLSELPVYETTLGSDLSAPEGIGGYLFGTSSLGRGNLGVLETDVGYVMIWHAVGLIGLIAALAIVVLLLRQAWESNLKAIGTFAVLWMLLMNLKELALFTRNQWTIQALILLLPVGIARPFGHRNGRPMAK